MRHVVHGEEVAHMWANQTQQWARNQRGNISFSGNRINSYSTMMGFIHESGVIFLNSQSYSITTSKHQRWIRHAIPGFKTVIRVPTSGLNSFHDMNRAFEMQIMQIIREKLPKARGLRDQHLHNLMELEDSRRQLFVIYKRKRSYKPLWSVPEGVDPVKFAADISRKAMIRKTRQENKEAREREEYRRKRMEEYAQNKLAWLNGTGHDLNWAGLEYDTDHLRINPDKPDEVETSRHARVPLRHVRRILKFVMNLISTGGTWKTNGHTIHLGDYALDAITCEGTVIAGCHKFVKEEVLRFAAILEALPPDNTPDPDEAKAPAETGSETAVLAQPDGVNA